MKALTLEILDQRAIRPMGNPFGVKCVECDGYQVPYVNIVKTGVKIELPDSMALMVISAQDGLMVLGWQMHSVEGLKVTVIRNDGHVDFREPFAVVHIVEKKSVPVRFVEFTAGGKRMISGEPQQVKTDG